MKTLLLLILTANVCVASLAYTNLGPTGAYDGYGLVLGPGINQATTFTPSSSGLLDQLSVGIFSWADTNSLTLRLRRDLQGEDLWRSTFADRLPHYGNALVLEDLNAAWIDAGQQYWLIAEASPRATWQLGVSGITSVAYQDALWHVSPAVRGFALSASTQSAIPGDANLDGRVDASDLGVLGLHWQQGASWTTADFNGDGVVNATDLGLLGTHWQGPVPSAVPEPTLAGLILLGLACMVRR